MEILRDLQVLELHQTGVSSHLMWRARDAFLGRLHPTVPLHRKEELRSSALSSSPFLFQEQAVDEIAATLKSDITLESSSKALRVLTATSRPGSAQGRTSNKRKPNTPANAPVAGGSSSLPKKVAKQVTIRQGSNKPFNKPKKSTGQHRNRKPQNK